MSDTTDIQRLASDKDVASTTKGIKHPYEDGMAEKWITSCQRRARLREIIHFAIILVRDEAFIGASTIHIDPDTPSAELSYWIGKPYWNEGYASEASKAIVQYGFSQLSLNRIYAAHFTRNPASGHVLKNAGMRYEGSQLGPTIKCGKMEKLELYGVSSEQFLKGNQGGA
jgi:ribosomal-protein-alanine N-acetyltransferase|tara:strand:+ start:2009 stop:2518 length:510 start_codon:yes stop_codon:yes gene_type:complete